MEIKLKQIEINGNKICSIYFNLFQSISIYFNLFQSISF